MNFGKRVLSAVIVLGCLAVFASPASAHNIFKKKISSEFPNVKISCNMCHVAKEPKSVRNEYGELFTKTFESKTLSADLAAMKDKKVDRAEIKKFEEEVMLKEFEKAYEKIKVMTFKDLLEAGVIQGAEVKEEK